MIVLLTILSIVAYIIIGAWTFGYVRGATQDKDGWETPFPLLSAIFCPLVLAIIGLSYIVVPIQQLGFTFQQAKLNKKKKRIADQEKIRIDLQKADKEIAEAELELEAEFQALEKATNNDKKKKKINKNINLLI